MAQSLTVNTPDGSYQIHIERGVRSRLSALFSSRRAVIVTNPMVTALHGEEISAAVPNSSLIEMPDGEQYKT